MGMCRGGALPGDRISSSSSSCVVLCCVVLCCVVLCCVVLCCVVLCCVVLCCVVLCCVVLCCVVLCCVVLCCVVLCCVVLCCVVLCCVVLCCVVLCCVVLCCVVLCCVFCGVWMEVPPFSTQEPSPVPLQVVLGVATGPVNRLLQAERTVLEVLTRASACATVARQAKQAVDAVGWQGLVAGTRKTTPGRFRLVEKYALLVAGVDTHRYSLSNMVMLKDNHIDACGGIAETVCCPAVPPRRWQGHLLSGGAVDAARTAHSSGHPLRHPGRSELVANDTAIAGTSTAKGARGAHVVQVLPQLTWPFAFARSTPSPRFAK